MVAGDHHDLDARAAAGLDRLVGFGARRVDQSGQPAEGVGQLFGGGRQRFGLGVGEAEHAQRPLRHFRRLIRRAGGVPAHRQDDVRRALEHREIAAFRLVYGNHIFPLGIERHLRHPRLGRVGAFGLALFGQRVFGRRGAVVAQQEQPEEVLAVAVRLDDGHSVLRERAGFVRADDRRAAQRLHAG